MAHTQIQFNTICRGSGKIFISLTTSGGDPSCTLNISSIANGTAVPARLYKDETRSTNTASAYILVLPQLRINQDVTFFDVSASGSLTPLFTKTFREFELKVSSKVNYRKNSAEAHRIRDYDKQRSIQDVQYELWDYISDGDFDIIRGRLTLPSTSPTAVSLQCFSENNQPIFKKYVVLSDKIVKPYEQVEFYQREIQFSIRVERNAQCHVFRVVDESGNLLLGFEALDRFQYAKFAEGGRLFSLNAQNDPRYHAWFLDHRITKRDIEIQKNARFNERPLFSIIVPLYKTPLSFFDDMIASVQKQSYSQWELILVNASPEIAELSARVDSLCDADARVKTIKLQSNLGITLNTNTGIEVATGDFVCFFDHDDVLEPDLLFEYTKAINSDAAIDILYCDEDKLLPDGHYVQPFFKPDFSIDLLRNNNYVCHLLTVRKTVLDRLPLATSEYDGAQDHNLVLKASEIARSIHHVSKILYHWRMSESSTAANADSKSYATAAGVRCVQEHLDRLNIKAAVQPSRRPFTYKVIYEVTDNPLVSIIIPTKDNVDLLDTCLNSIVSKSTYQNYEIILIENNSEDPRTFEYYASLVKRFDRIRVEYWGEEFNYSKLNNFGASKAAGDFLLLLNNDTEVISPDWIERMLGICQREDVGAVGARLYYKDDTIQHAGLCVAGLVAGHLNHGLPKGDYGYFALCDAEQNLSAVTAACMMTKKSIYDAVGGFTEDLAVAFNDVDFCLKIRDLDKLIVYTPEVELFHYESISRGYENTPEKRERFQKEYAYMNARWATYYTEGDPYKNRNFNAIEPYNMYYSL